MITAAETTAEALGSFLVGDYRRYFGAGEGRRADLHARPDSSSGLRLDPGVFLR